MLCYQTPTKLVSHKIILKYKSSYIICIILSINNANVIISEFFLSLSFLKIRTPYNLEQRRITEAVFQCLAKTNVSICTIVTP